MKLSTSGSAQCSAFPRRGALLPALGRRGGLQQAGESFGWIVTDDQAFFRRPWLHKPSWLSWLFHFGHDPYAIKRGAPAGGRTRTTRKSPACKAGAFASYATGARSDQENSAPDVGAGGCSNPQPAPTRFESSSAATHAKVRPQRHPLEKSLAEGAGESSAARVTYTDPCGTACRSSHGVHE